MFYYLTFFTMETDGKRCERKWGESEKKDRKYLGEILDAGLAMVNSVKGPLPNLSKGQRRFREGFMAGEDDRTVTRFPGR